MNTNDFEKEEDFDSDAQLDLPEPDSEFQDSEEEEEEPTFNQEKFDQWLQGGLAYLPEKKAKIEKDENIQTSNYNSDYNNDYISGYNSDYNTDFKNRNTKLQPQTQTNPEIRLKQNEIKSPQAYQTQDSSNTQDISKKPSTNKTPKPRNQFLKGVLTSVNTFNNRIVKDSTNNLKDKDKEKQQLKSDTQKQKNTEKDNSNTIEEIQTIISENTDTMISLIDYYQKMEGISIIQALAKRYQISITIHDKPIPPKNSEMIDISKTINSQISKSPQETHENDSEDDHISSFATAFGGNKTPTSPTSTPSKNPDSFQKTNTFQKSKHQKFSKKQYQTKKTKPQISYNTGAIGYNPRGK